MASAPRKTSRPVVSVVLGLLAALAAATAHYAGLDRHAELHALDVRFRRVPSSLPSGDIVHVDIDDRSIAELGRWPWPREKLAGIIDVLSECGARSVVLDIIMPDPQKVRYVSPADEVYGPDDSAGLADAPPTLVFDDVILARAISAAPDVAMPMFIDPDPPVAGELDYLLETLLAGDPTMSAAAAAACLGKEVNVIAPGLPRARKKAIDALTADAIARRPGAGFASVLRDVLGDTPAGARSPYHDIVDKAYLRHRAINAMERFTISPARVAGYPLFQGEMTPPLVTFAQTLGLCGFATVTPDVDGVVRRIALLGASGKQVYPQFALALASGELSRAGGGPAVISADQSSVTIDAGDGGRRRIPVDQHGRMLVRWHRGPNAARHIPAVAVATISVEKAKLRRHVDLAHALCVRFLSLGVALPNEKLEGVFFEFSQQTQKLDEAYLRRVAEQRHGRRAMLYDPAGVGDGEQLALLERAEHDIEEVVTTSARTLVGELRKPANFDVFVPLASQDARAQATMILKMLDALPARQQQIQDNLADLAAELRGIVAGNICMIGSTSTGGADFVPTPLGPRTPGVVVHSNIIETILSGRFLRRAHWAVDLAVILAGGAIVSLLTAIRSIVHAAWMVVLLGAGYVGLNAFVVFGVWNVWLVVIAPLGAMAASFVVVTAFRQLTEERAKKYIRDMFAHALSPALVDQLLADPSLAELGGQKRSLTCMFSDLGGFTPLAQRLGPQETVRLLNRYFDRVTDVVQNRGGGYLNKFLGDGIFCFFGAPVLQDDHPARAITAGVECLAEVDQLNKSLIDELGSHAQLSVRVGITTGEAMVGNCGSSERMDYTAIGDCVNLASRLESANKFFGTHILVSEEAWRAGGADLPARPMGTVSITGVANPVRIWEVLPPNTDELSAGALADFADAIERFGRRQFTAAGELLESVAAGSPTDTPTRIYLDLARICAANPQATDDWPSGCNSGEGVVHIIFPSRDA